MKKFLRKASLFFVLTIAGLAAILMNFGGYVDYFYEKFTVPKQTSMILGDSRSLQGIQPRIIDKELSGKFELPMFNYSFTIAQVAYGKPYSKSVLHKLNRNTKNGLFILSVHPWILSERDTDNLRNNVYGEADAPPHNMVFTEMNPNFEYFVRNRRYFHFKTLFSPTAIAHKDGWLEERFLRKDSVAFKQSLADQLKTYDNFAQKWAPSEIRLHDMENLIDSLSNHGRIVLVRMPVHKQIRSLEDKYWPEFDEKMLQISMSKHIPYFNLSDDPHFKTYDGNHIDRFVGARFTKRLADLIRKDY